MIRDQLRGDVGLSISTTNQCPCLLDEGFNSLSMSSLNCENSSFPLNNFPFTTNAGVPFMPSRYASARSLFSVFRVASDATHCSNLPRSSAISAAIDRSVAGVSDDAAYTASWYSQKRPCSSAQTAALAGER